MHYYDKKQQNNTIQIYKSTTQKGQSQLMRILGNILWWIFGGLEAAVGYFTGSLTMALTIIGLPIALQTFKIGLLCLWPFGAEIRKGESFPKLG